jgi:hypothetical protein
MPRRTNSSQRRYKFADKVFFLCSLAMRFCTACRRAGTVYLVSNESDFYKQCLRYNRFCDLAFSTHK